MPTRLALLIALLASSSLQAAPRVWVSISTLGMEESQERALRDRVAAQINEAGGAPHAADDSACFDEASCAQGRIAELGAVAAVDVRVVLAGDVVQLSAQLFDGAGALVVRDQSVIEARDLANGLSAPLQRALAPLLEVKSAPKETPEVSPPEDTPPPDDAPPEEARPGDFPVLGVAGLATAAVGAAVGLVGLAIANNAAATLDDGTSSGAEKADAQNLGWVGVGLGITGGVIAVTGGALAFIGFSE